MLAVRARWPDNLLGMLPRRGSDEDAFAEVDATNNSIVSRPSFAEPRERADPKINAFAAAAHRQRLGVMVSEVNQLTPLLRDACPLGACRWLGAKSATRKAQRQIRQEVRI